MDYDPATRIKPMQALNHPFLREDDQMTSPTAGGDGSNTGIATAASASAHPRISVSTLAMEGDDKGTAAVNASIFATAAPNTAGTTKTATNAVTSSTSGFGGVGAKVPLPAIGRVGACAVA